MKIRLFIGMILILLLLPVMGWAATIINADYALYLYNMVDLDRSKETLLPLSAEINAMNRPELEVLSDLLDKELSDAYAYYWKMTRQARENGVEVDLSGWEGTFLPGVHLEDRDRLTLLLTYIRQRIGDT